MVSMDIIAEGLLFPEGPIAMDDSSVVLVEIARQTLSRVSASGEITIVAECGGGPNGAALGPDGRVYICNNGGFNEELDPSGFFGTFGMSRDYVGGSIQVVDLATDQVETLYTECNGHALKGPNDIVFDHTGGFWFTDLGKSWSRHHDHGGLYYAHADGSKISEAIYPLITPNGVGLSPDGKTLYAAETDTGRLWAWPVTGPGTVDKTKRRLLYSLPSTGRFDSLAVDSAGNICVGTLGSGGGISVVSPDGSAELIPTGDPLTTNICFGGPDLQTAYLTCSRSGTLRTMAWPRPGLALNGQS